MKRWCAAACCVPPPALRNTARSDVTDIAPSIEVLCALPLIKSRYVNARAVEPVHCRQNVSKPHIAYTDVGSGDVSARALSAPLLIPLPTPKVPFTPKRLKTGSIGVSIPAYDISIGSSKVLGIGNGEKRHQYK